MSERHNAGFFFERAHQAKPSRPVIGTPRKIERVSLVREKRRKKRGELPFKSGTIDPTAPDSEDLSHRFSLA